MGNVIHFEIMGNDTVKLKKFYADVLGWKINDANMPGMEYLLADTGQGDGINGAIFSNPTQTQHVINTVEVDDVEAVIEKVKAAGGAIDGDGKIHEIPGIGTHAYIKDVEGIIHGIMKPTAEYKERLSSN